MTLAATLRAMTARLRADRADTSRQRGFTLIELSIVLVIIGLLVGGIVKGQELVQNARGNKAQQELQQIATAVLNYRTRFGRSPIGDTTLGAAAANAGWQNLRLSGLLDLPDSANATGTDIAPANSLRAATPGFAMAAAASTTATENPADFAATAIVVCALSLPAGQAAAVASGMGATNYTTDTNVRTQATDTTTATVITGDAAAPTTATANYNVCVRVAS